MKRTEKAENRLRQTVAAVIVLAAVLLTGCGGNSKSMATSAGAAVTMDEAPQEMAEIYEASAEESDGGENTAQDDAYATAGRKLIKEVYLDVETEAYTELINAADKKIKELGGYTESSYTAGGGYEGSLQHGEICARIPEKRLNEFVVSVEGASNVMSKRENTQDVTLQYVDLESHKKALLAEQESLLGLMEKAGSVEDIITLESRLTDVRYQLESMESQLRTYDNQIEFSTVYITISEVVRLSPVVHEKSAWERIRTGFTENVYRVRNGLENFGIGVLVNLPYIIVWVVVILFFIMAVRLTTKWIDKRNRKGKALQNAVQPMNRADYMPSGIKKDPAAAEMEKPNGQ